jgi:hypothetical protein
LVDPVPPAPAPPQAPWLPRVEALAGSAPDGPAAALLVQFKNLAAQLESLAAAPPAPAPVPIPPSESEERGRLDDAAENAAQTHAKRQRGLNGAPTAQPPGAASSESAAAAGGGGNETPQNRPLREEEEDAVVEEVPPGDGDPIQSNPSHGRLPAGRLDIWGGGTRR